MATRKRSASKRQPIEPLPVVVPGWSIGDSFACIRGRRWVVVGFARSTVSTLLVARCVADGTEAVGHVGMRAQFLASAVLEARHDEQT